MMLTIMKGMVIRIKMNDIIIFIEKLPVVLSYIVYGGVFLNVFDYIGLKAKKESNLYKMVSYIIVSYILKSFYDLVAVNLYNFSNTESIGYLTTTIIITAILAFVLATVCKSDIAKTIIDKLDIRRSSGETIWNDLVKKDMWVIAQRKDSSDLYFGFADYIEECSRNPKFALKHYAIGDMAQHKIIADKTEEDNYIVIDAEEMETIEVLYNDGKVKIWEYFNKKIGTI